MVPLSWVTDKETCLCWQTDQVQRFQEFCETHATFWSNWWNQHRDTEEGLVSLSLLLSMGRAWNIDTIANWSGFLSDRERVAVAELLSYQSGHGPWPRVRWLNIAIKFLLDEPIRFFIFKENYIDITSTSTLIQGKNFVNLYGITVFLSHACFSRPTVMRRRTRCELTIH